LPEIERRMHSASVLVDIADPIPMPRAERPHRGAASALRAVSGPFEQALDPHARMT
jgi:hypothetical protein